MSQNQTVPWLVTYDIANPRRLARVFKRLKKEGIPMQYSVFAVDTSAQKMGVLMAALATLIDGKADDDQQMGEASKGRLRRLASVIDWQPALDLFVKTPDHELIENIAGYLWTIPTKNLRRLRLF